jgi:dimethylargininase
VTSTKTYPSVEATTGLAARVRNSTFGVGSMAGPLQRVAMRSLGAIRTADPSQWHYTKPIEADALQSQYNALVGLLGGAGVEIMWIDGDGADLADSVLTYDPSFMTPHGAILLRPGKELRLGEVELHNAFYRRSGVPIIGQIEAPGTVDGGDLFWGTPTSLLTGRGFRTNSSGLAQLTAILDPYGIGVLSFGLPFHEGPEACLHLMSLVSPLGHKLALVYLPLLPAPLYQYLTKRGWELLAAPREEFEATGGMNVNVLATGPRQCIAIEECEATLKLMRSAGCEMSTYSGTELCIPCEGGPTCLTRPILRG